MKLRSAAKALIRRRDDGKYLILTSSKWEENPLRSQKPDLPGGLIEEGESIERGLIRELHEEIGAEIAEADLRLVYASTYVDEGMSSSTVFLLYFIELDSVDVTLSWEHEAFEWMTAEQVRRLDIREPYPAIFEHFHKVGLL